MSSRRSNLHVLLIEDSDDDAYFFSRLLKKSDVPHRYTRICDGRAALTYLVECLSSEEKIESTRPHLIFIDLKLPVVSGFEILEWLAVRKQESSIEVAVLSGSDQQADVARATSLGAADYFVKPLALQQLRNRLDRWQNANVTKLGRDGVAAE